MFLEQRACHRTLSLARYTGDVGRLRGRTVAENRSSQKEAGCFHASQGKLIHQATFLWQQMKREKKKQQSQPYSACPGHILSLGHSWVTCHTSHPPQSKQGESSLGLRKVMLPAPSALWSINPLYLSAPAGPSGLATAELSSLGKAWERH